MKDQITDKIKQNKKVFNLIILDESGSMQSIYRPALSGLNETLQTIRSAGQAHADQQHFVTLITFDSEHYKKIYDNLPAEKTVDVTPEQYRPFACTPLFDTMGRAIYEMNNTADKDDIVLVTIITDGYENASTEYNCTAIKNLVEQMKEKGWIFTYIGANQDVLAVASSLAIDNHLEFSADADGTSEMFARENRSRRNFMERLSMNEAIEELKGNYFEE